MKTEIAIVSWAKDIEYLKGCLSSIRKFASGFSGVTLLVPEQERNQFSWVQEVDLKTYDRVADSRLFHLQHQAMKCRADEWCPDADLIFFMDSDCFFIEPVTPADYLVNGKPVLCIENFARLGGNPWKATTDRALGINSQFETMRRHGAIHYRGLFPEFRKLVENVNKMPFMDYVLSCKPDYPWGYSEFVALGNFALMSHWRPKYHFIDVGEQAYPPDHLLDVWSHAPPEAAQGDRYRGKFPGNMTVRQIWQQLGL